MSETHCMYLRNVIFLFCHLIHFPATNPHDFPHPPTILVLLDKKSSKKDPQKGLRPTLDID